MIFIMRCDCSQNRLKKMSKPVLINDKPNFFLSCNFDVLKSVAIFLNGNAVQRIAKL